MTPDGSTPTSFRHLRGGLDNAVAQAEARGLHELFIVDCDCHIQEPYSMFLSTLPPPYRRGLAETYHEEEDPLLATQNSLDQKVQLAANRIQRPETSFPRQQRPNEIVDEFAIRMVDLGIKRSLIIPNMIVRLPLDPRPPRFEAEVARSYINFMIDNFGDYPEIRFVLYVPVKDPLKGAELIDDVGSEKGVAGVLLSALTRTRAGSDDWNPIYEAAQRKNLPVCIHGDSLQGDEKGWLFGDFDTLLSVHALAFPLTVARHITSIVFDGVPERYPKLKFVFMEGGVTFIPSLMQRLDDDYIKRRNEAPLLTRLPSEYMDEFYYTTQPLESAHRSALEPFFRMFDAENRLLYASDYPHWDFDAPSVIYDLPFLSKDAKRKILGENARNVFRIR